MLSQIVLGGVSLRLDEPDGKGLVLKRTWLQLMCCISPYTGSLFKKQKTQSEQRNTKVKDFGGT